MKKQSFFVPRPNSINAINPRREKRQPSGSFKAISAIGAARQEGEFGGAVDKIASAVIRKYASRLLKIAVSDSWVALKLKRGVTERAYESKDMLKNTLTGHPIDLKRAAKLKGTEAQVGRIVDGFGGRAARILSKL
jgi:hypothetical protein